MGNKKDKKVEIGQESINRKEYIEYMNLVDQKKTQIKNFVRGLIATGLVVGTVLTATGCRTNHGDEMDSTITSNTSETLVEPAQTTEPSETTQVSRPAETTGPSDTTQLPGPSQDKDIIDETPRDEKAVTIAPEDKLISPIEPKKFPETDNESHKRMYDALSLAISYNNVATVGEISLQKVDNGKSATINFGNLEYDQKQKMISHKILSEYGSFPISMDLYKQICDVYNIPHDVPFALYFETEDFLQKVSNEQLDTISQIVFDEYTQDNSLQK